MIGLIVPSVTSHPQHRPEQEESLKHPVVLRRLRLH